ncbi:xanthine dehydrogenase small subunit [Rubrimonas cliftonensis]|uniref:Xanthine dehydrogenase small subunit n=1 Tax=Rubrimonas cliftonensis TaxID=89524 RepID=A0A1H3YVM6_9RHOB|nr:xanthine dehydrogenase small subunit [Rubrimonas cliftonensis]SEA15241.1 xanthine dehydrogenase small subunit [Rubrimonas cliftonensis]
MARDHVRLLLNDDAVSARPGPRDTLLDFLRLERRLRGTKEGCAEGDCGACTVLVGRPDGDGMSYAPVNACIRLTGSLDGAHVVTVEGLGTPAAPHPVQAAMVAHHGSQCGFCTPGIVMALAALRMQGGRPSDAEIDRALQGNLCRCTGYAPIVRAAEAACAAPREADPLTAGAGAVAARLRAMADGARIDIGAGEDRLIVPSDADDLAAALAEAPGATLVAGATDVGLWITKNLRPVGATILIGGVRELHVIEESAAGLRLGACVSYAQAAPALLRAHPELAALWSRIGGPQVRAMGTIGGNIANGSPIGDTPPPFIALGARLTLRRGAARRETALEDFFLGYGEQDRAADEFIESVFLPAPGPGERLRVAKLSKRRDEDISTVCGAMWLRLDASGTVEAARIAFGGMAGTPARAPCAEAALVGKIWGEAAAEAAAAALAADFAPLSDWRGSAAYRRIAAANLLRRFALEDAGAQGLEVA